MTSKEDGWKRENDMMTARKRRDTR